MNKMNVMKNIRVEKVTLNIGAGKDTVMLDKGIKLIKNITGIAPVKTITQKRIPGWGLRPGLPIGCKLTLRGKKALEIVPRLLAAKDNVLTAKNYDVAGNISFGIPECIDIEGSQYDPEIGIIGLQVCITLTRPGYRIKNRHLRSTKVPNSHRIAKEEAIAFMENSFKTKMEEAE